MELGERQQKILQAIIDAYIETAEPVGSRTLSKREDLNLSAATIRNEMADLEEMGFLEQPHTSAGRVPSQLGYRFYVNSLMQRYRLSLEEMQRLNAAMQVQFNELGRLMTHISRLVSEFTDYTAIATLPSKEDVVVKKFDILTVDEHTFLVLLITNSDEARTRVFHITTPVNSVLLLRIKTLLSSALVGKPVSKIRLDNVLRADPQLGDHAELMLPVLSFVSEILDDLSQEQLFFAGQKKILRQPEFQDVERACRFLDVLDNRQALQELLHDSRAQARTAIFIGDETAMLRQHDASIVLSRFGTGDHSGIIGIIGPTRMDYAKAVASLEYFTKHLSRLLRTPDGDEQVEEN